MNYLVNVNIDGYISIEANSKDEAIDLVCKKPYEELIQYLSDYGAMAIGNDVIEDEE